MNKRFASERTRAKKASILDLLITCLLCAFLLTTSWFLSKLFDEIRADESFIFGVLGVFLLLTLAFVFLQWRRHGSIWIGVLQGFALSAFAAFPVFRGEPDMEPITGPLVIGLLGGLLAGAIIAICRLVRGRVKAFQPIAQPGRFAEENGISGHGEMAKKIVDSVAREMSDFKFVHRFDNISTTIVGVVKKSWSQLHRFIGAQGIVALVRAPASVTDRAQLKALFKSVRKKINSQFVGFAAWKSSYSFIVLLCDHILYTRCAGIASQFKDKTGLHMNIILGVIFIDAETCEVSGERTRLAKHKREYDAVLSATLKAIK